MFSDPVVDEIKKYKGDFDERFLNLWSNEYAKRADDFRKLCIVQILIDYEPLNSNNGFKLVINFNLLA